MASSSELFGLVDRTTPFPPVSFAAEWCSATRTAFNRFDFSMFEGSRSEWANSPLDEVGCHRRPQCTGMWFAVRGGLPTSSGRSSPVTTLHADVQADRL